MVGRGRGGNIRSSLRVDSDTVIGNLSNISVVVVGGVLDMLGTAVGKSNIVRSRHNTGSISSLSSVEVSLGIVISNSVGVSVRLINMGRLNISGCGVISRGWGVCRGSMDDRGMVDIWGMVDSMSDWVCNKTMVSNKSLVSNWMSSKSMVGNWMSNKSMVGKRMGNKSMVGYWVSNKPMVGYWVSNHSMVGCPMGDNSTMSMDNLVGRHSRGGGGGSKAKKSRNNESLKFVFFI